MAKTELDLVVLNDTSATLKEKLNELMGRDLSADFTVRGNLEQMPMVDLLQLLLFVSFLGVVGQ